jgi:hypothetical protein
MSFVRIRMTTYPVFGAVGAGGAWFLRDLSPGCATFCLK